MLQLHDIKKEYYIANQPIHALKGINLAFREREFVAILGPSGCGKTTLLNLIGGLDRYTSGDIQIDGVSTKSYSDKEWDAYRNHRIGFVFQNYNLISHISVLRNVEMALTLSGVSAKERRDRAIHALEQVGLADQVRKKPNQLSGGQMQRVAIARALVNDPNIILADEPTGALDSKTSVQIMNILRSISKDKLIVMVTHNPEIAEQYSDRMINLLDGEVIDDSNPYTPSKEDEVTQKEKKTAMSYLTALNLSFNNLITKKIRTIVTAIAGSIGIIGVALVLSLSNGFTQYVDTIESDLLVGLPITVERTAFILPSGPPVDTNDGEFESFPNTDYVTPYLPQNESSSLIWNNIITQNYLNYLEGLDSSWYADVTYSYNVDPVLLRQLSDNSIVTVNLSSYRMRQLASDNTEFLATQYDLLAGEFPQASSFQAVLIINQYNQLHESVLTALGYSGNDIEVPFTDFIGTTFTLVDNNSYYQKVGDYYQTQAEVAFNTPDAQTVEIVGVLRIKPEANNDILSVGIGYGSYLTEYVLSQSATSDIVLDQYLLFQEGEASGTYYSVFSAAQITRLESLELLAKLGAPQMPNSITIYPTSFAAKQEIARYLRAYNNQFGEDQAHMRIIHNDLAETISSVMSQMIDTITIVLVAFAGISLFVSSIMIGIITYVSVIERTKEIGVLRSLGARKKDISRVFNAETIIIGATAGIFGVLVTYALTPILNAILYSYTDTKDIAQLNIFHALSLIVISIALTLIAGLVPAKIASKKDPVVALRTE